MIARIYFISGLGADRRVFRKLVFPPDFELVYLDWITAENSESLEKYAERLAASIDASFPFYLVGLSMGGMIATEIARRLSPIHTFIISSAPDYMGLPWYFKFAGALKLQKLVTVGLLKQSKYVSGTLLGGRTKEERILLKKLIMDSDPLFMKWAINSILCWRNIEIPSNLTHIHGTNDKTLPIRYVKPDVIINGGTHFMIYANAPQISEILSAILLKDGQLDS